VNLVVVAIVLEYEESILGSLGGSRLALVVGMWIFAVIAWLVAGLAAPLATDNRPRLDNNL
jgi:hypothetical protein